jgi:hypothetical protein
MKSRSLETAWFWVVPPNRLMTAVIMSSVILIFLLILNPIMAKTSLPSCENSAIHSIIQINKSIPDNNFNSKDDPVSVKAEDICLRVAFIYGDGYELILSDLHSTNVRYIYV